MSDQENVSCTLTVPAPAERVFEVLADPTTHPSIDGTGWVAQAVDREPLAGTGQIFRMDMYHPGHPAKNYRMANKVEVFEPARAIAWLPGNEQEDGRVEFPGWYWRYDLAPLGPSETEVTLSYDWSAVPQSVREYLPVPPFGPEHLSNSLDHLAALATSTQGS